MSLRGVDRFREYTRKHKELTAFIIALICTALVLLMAFPPFSYIVVILFIAATITFVFSGLFKICLFTIVSFLVERVLVWTTRESKEHIWPHEVDIVKTAAI